MSASSPQRRTNRPRRTGVLTAVLAATDVVVVAPGTAQASAVCHPVSAWGIGNDLGEGRTAAVVFGDRILTGTTQGQFTATGVDGAVVSLAGTVDLRLLRGRLHTDVTGTFDTASGRFTARTSTVSGTRGLAGANGELLFAGTQNANGRFTETVTGALCVARGATE